MVSNPITRVKIITGHSFIIYCQHFSQLLKYLADELNESFLKVPKQLKCVSILSNQWFVFHRLFLPLIVNGCGFSIHYVAI